MVLKIQKQREKIFQLFIYNERLTFSQILKQIRMPSNLLAYFLKKMVKEEMLEKRAGSYKLTPSSEKLIPFFVKDSEMISPLVVVLIALVDGDKVLLVKRDKRPYKGFWSIISGRLLINESINEAAIRIVKEKAYTSSQVIGVKSVVYERLIEKDKSKHGFVFFLVEAQAKTPKMVKEKDYLKWFDIKKLNKRKTIASDYWMLKELLKENIIVHEETLVETKKSTKMKLL
jgi:ADP-ribose pyrophosphatase YjhB (NUDIX family)